MSTISVTNINDGDAVTAASINNQVNTIVNDYNGNITAANLATNSVTTAKITNSTVTADKLATGAIGATVATSETTTSTAYADLTTTTDSVTATIGANGLAIVSLQANMGNSVTNAFVFCSFAVSGANTIAVGDGTALMFQNSGGGVSVQISTCLLLTGLTPGSTTFKLKYRVQTGGGGSGTGTFGNRRIAVIPL